jgi:glycosyltransferase involved in cell wall biosynthesis
MTTVFFAFRDAPDRRAALRDPESLDRYRLFGLDEIRARGADVRHNLERGSAPPLPATVVAASLNRLLRFSGGYGGDFATVLASLRAANEADVVFSTSDTVGLPLVLLSRAHLLRPPLVYAAVGLPERLVHLRGTAMRRLYARALRRAETIVTYAQAEAEHIRAWLGDGSPPVRFVPFGVDINQFSPAYNREPEFEVVSVGADPHRDLELLIAVARRNQHMRFQLVTTTAQLGTLGELPASVSVETDVPLERVRDCLARARVVALPVRPNSYSGATTVLLQAMAMAKPVIVSRTDAIATGYQLEDRVNCRLVSPGDVEAFERAVVETVADANASASLGVRATELVKRNFSWARYTKELQEILSQAASGASPSP